MMKVFGFIVLMLPLCLTSMWLFQCCLFLLCFLFMLMVSVNHVFCNVSLMFGYDNFSYFLILLSLWLSGLMIMASAMIKKLNYYYKGFMFIVLLLLFSLIMIFSSLNMFVFYLFFEVSLIPMLVLIIGWGYQPERLMAGMYMIFYTLFFSLPMMVGLFYLYTQENSLNFFLVNSGFSLILYLLINLIFFVKIPMIMIHLWLPKAHVEAPVSGSMILAGVMLKLGGYGLIRFMKMFIFWGIKFNIYFIVLSLLGGLMISFVCLFQTDMKSLIAYSSVSHMSLVVAGILTMNYLGFYGALFLMVGHGLCSSGLFCMANLYYERVGSRSFYLTKGLLNIMPSFSLWMFMFSACNMAAPPSLNLLGEIILFNSLMSFSSMFLGILMSLSFMSAVYSVYLYSYSNHGKISVSLFSSYFGLSREYLLLSLHWLPLNILFLNSDLVNFL